MFEQVQKDALSNITRKRNSYKENLKKLGLETLKERRIILSARFAQKCFRNQKTEDMFERNIRNLKPQE